MITPTQAITISTARPIFDWEDAVDNVGVVSYRLTLTESNPFSRVLSVQDVVATVITSQSGYTPTVNMPNGIYTWAVAVYDAAGNVGFAQTKARFAIEVNADSGHQSAYLPVILKE